MNKIFILLILLLIFCGFCNAQNTFTLKDIKSKIETAEKETNTYYGDSLPLEDRLKNLEIYIFGSAKSGDMEKRLISIYKTLGIPSENQNTKETEPKYEIENDITANYPSIDKLEKQNFNKVYDKENIYQRLDRLEKKINGKTSSKSLNERVSDLQDKNYEGTDFYQQKKALPSYNSTSDEYNYYSAKNSNSVIDSIEKKIWKRSFDGEAINKRLSRIENKIFGKEFSNDSDSTRIERIKSVVKAAKSGQEYKVNKFAKYAATGIQVGGLILLILAMIL